MSQDDQGSTAKERHPLIWRADKIAAELLVLFVVSYGVGYLGIKIILAPDGLLLWTFWFGSIYSFTASDSAQTYLSERLMKRYARYQILRFAFFILAIYISGEATLSYQTTFNLFLASPSTQQYIGYWILGLSAGAFDTAYVYFRLKYRKPKDTTVPKAPPVPKVLKGLLASP